MEQGQCWMWTTNKRKNSLSSSGLVPSQTNYYSSSYDDSSWEEQAFAKDASGTGCIWPPRSYSCTFCRREFRSAQALGGHMNVHRRDRARLKQPSSPQDNETHDFETHQSSFASMNYLYPSKSSSLSGFACNTTNPNSDDPSNSHVVLASPSNKIIMPINKSQREKTMINPSLYDSSSSFSPVHSAKSLSNLNEECRFHSQKFNPEALSLNLLVCRAHKSPMQFQETEISFKKRKTEASSNIPFFTKSSSVGRNHVKSKVLEFSPSSIEELDLELRLGNRTKVGNDI